MKASMLFALRKAYRRSERLLSWRNRPCPLCPHRPKRTFFIAYMHMYLAVGLMSSQRDTVCRATRHLVRVGRPGNLGSKDFSLAVRNATKRTRPPTTASNSKPVCLPAASELPRAGRPSSAMERSMAAAEMSPILREDRRRLPRS